MRGEKKKKKKAGLSGKKGLFDARGKKNEEIAENLSAYSSVRHVRLRGKWKAERGAEDTKLAVSENYVNIRYWNSQLIRDALAYIYDYVSAVTLGQTVVDIAVEVTSRHTDGEVRTLCAGMKSRAAGRRCRGAPHKSSLCSAATSHKNQSHFYIPVWLPPSLHPCFLFGPRFKSPLSLSSLSSALTPPLRPPRPQTSGGGVSGWGPPSTLTTAEREKKRNMSVSVGGRR